MAAGARGGGVVNGVIGGVTGTVTGVRQGISSGSHSTPAAALTLGAVGAVGLVEWPVLLAVGGAALLLRQLKGQPVTRADAAAPRKPAAPRKAAAPGRAKQTSARTRRTVG